MKIQKLAIATLVAAVFIALMDMLWYTVIMKDAMEMPGARPQPDWMWLFISYIIFSVAFVSIYGAWSGGGTKVSSGLNFGIWTGLIVGLSMNLMWFSLTTTVTLSQALTDSVYTIVKCILLGILVAYATGLPGYDGRGKAAGGGEG